MNKCRICWKEIWPKYTDKVLRCDSCREEIDRKLAWCKFYWPQPYEVVDEMDILKNENKKLKEENERLKSENEYRASIVDVVPEWEWHIAEETIQDLQKRIDELVWFEKEYHRSRDRIKKLERVLEHEYGRKVPY